MTERIAVFIDGGYFEKICQDEFGSPRVDFKLLSNAMAGGVSHVRTYYYHCLPYQGNPPTPEESARVSNRQKFFYALENIDRFQVRLGTLRKRVGGFEQKGVDVYLAIDLVQLAIKRLITQAAIMTADTDFVPAIEVAKNEGVVIKLFHSQNVGNNSKLWHSADERIVINNDFINQIERTTLI